jgi:hypothetical protein
VRRNVADFDGFRANHKRITGVLRGIGARFKLANGCRELLRAASVFLVVLMGGMFAVPAGRFFPFFPFIYAVLSALVFCFILYLVLRSAAEALPALTVASRLETAVPRLKDDVTNALLLYEERGGKRRFRDGGNAEGTGPVYSGLVAAHLEKTADSISAIRPDQLVSFRRALLPAARSLYFILAAFAAAFVVQPGFPRRSMAFLLDPLSSLPPRDTVISVERVPSPVLRGTPVSISAKAEGFVPERLALRIWPQTGPAVITDMAHEGDGLFVHRVDSIRTSIRYQAFGGRAESPVYGLAVTDAPDIEGVKLTLVPPAYSRLPREVRDGGHVDALKGTVVNLEARATKPVKEGRLVINRSEKTSLEVSRNILRSTLFVLTPGVYSLRVEDEFGFSNPDPVEYSIRIVPDNVPECDVDFPAEGVEVLGNELLPVAYSVKDDFGISSVNLLYQTTRAQGSIALKQMLNVRAIGQELYVWDLEDLALVAGDRVSFRLETWDNDSISGPKAGYSRTYTLRVKDEKEPAAKETKLAREIADSLLDLLADQLERTKDRRELSGDVAKIMEKVDEQLGRMDPDRLERFELEALKRNLESLDGRMQDLPDEIATREIERLNLLAEGLAERARMNEAQALSRELRNRQRRLMDEMQNLDGTVSKDELGALMEELLELKDLLSRVMEALRDAAAPLPEELAGSPDLSGLDFQEMFEALEEMEKKLAAGDTQGALEIARMMLDALSDMLAALSTNGDRAAADSLGRIGSEMNRQASELERILNEQKEILKGTESVDRELDRLKEAAARRNLEQSAGRIGELLNRLREALGSNESAASAEMESYLKERNIEKLEVAVRKLRERAGGGTGAMEPEGEAAPAEGPRDEMPGGEGPVEEEHSVVALLEDLLETLEGLEPGKDGVMTGTERKRLSDLSSRQGRLEGRTSELAQRLDMLSQLFPGIDISILDDLRGAVEAMDSAEGNLRREDAPGAIPPEEEAIRRLSRSREGMQQGAQRMGREQALRMQADRWGVPWGYDNRPGWYSGQRIPLPTLPQPEVRKQREKGRTGIDTEEFDPPSSDAYKAPPNLREKIMEALKEDIPPRYRRDVERYFRGLTE